jgi:hypothetical protein
MSYRVFFSLPLSLSLSICRRSDTFIIGHNVFHRSNDISCVVAQQALSIDRSFVSVIIFAQHDAVRVRPICSPYSSQTTIIEQ